jgi:hypothetical protein
MSFTFKSLYTELNATNKTSYYITVHMNIWNVLSKLKEYMLNVSRSIHKEAELKMDVNNGQEKENYFS